MNDAYANMVSNLFVFVVSASCASVLQDSEIEIVRTLAVSHGVKRTPINLCGQAMIGICHTLPECVISIFQANISRRGEVLLYGSYEVTITDLYLLKKRKRSVKGQSIAK